MTKVMYYNSLERMLVGAYLTLTILSVIAYYFRARKTEKSDDKLIFFGIAFAFLGFFLGRLFLFFAEINDFLIYDGYFVLDAFYMDQAQVVDPSIVPLNHTYLVLASSLSVIIAAIVFIFIIERITKKTKYAVTLIFSILTVIGMTLPYELSMTFINTLISTPILLLMIILISFIPKWTSDEFKPVILILISGVALYLIGNFLTFHPVKRLGLFPIVLGPLVLVAASSMWLLAPLISSDASKRYVNRFKLLAVITLVISTVFSISLLFIILDILTIAQLVLSTALMFFAVYNVLKSFNGSSTSNSPD
jgi:hypothetical protein